MTTKVYLHFEQSDYPEQTLKVQVPKAWMEKPVTAMIELFINNYNKKNTESVLSVEALEENYHLVTSEQEKVYSNGIIKDSLQDRNDYYLKFGKHVLPVTNVAAIDAAAAGMLRCKNYGCNQFYKEEENEEGCCQHHSGPPIFHDTMKCWSCCRDRKAYDFEGFQLISGCNRGRHSQVAQKVAIGASPNAVVDADGNSTLPTPPPAPVLKSISDFNKSNPAAASAVTSAVKTLENRKSSRNTADGTARCQRKGCQKTFIVDCNDATACCYHAGQPIFHDAVKFWSCCPEKKCYDFDEFLKVNGCCTSFHDDGVIDLETGKEIA